MKILIVIDMQNDFIDGALGTPEAQAIVPNVKKKIQEYLDRKDIVIFTRDTHDEYYPHTQEGKNLPVPHCIIDSHGWEICDELPGTENAHIINKESFGYPYWSRIFDFGSRDELEMCGLCTDICVISNAMILKADFPEVKITVDASCCAGVTPQSHKNALEAMKMCQINVIGE